MIKFDFWDCDSVLTGLSELYGLDENAILRMNNIEALCEDNPVATFIEKADIKLDSVDVSHVMLHCKHIMTIDDKFATIKKYGLLPLDKVLTYDTPLHDFLFEHGIEIDVDSRNVFYKGNEVYLSGRLDEVHGYSCVKYNPEILTTLEQMISKLFKESPHLETDWRKRQAGEYYCLDFDVNICDFEAITTRPVFENYEDYFEFNKELMYGLYNVRPNFYGNVFILERSLPILLGEKPTVYGQLLPSVKISYDDIIVSRSHI